MFRQALRQSRSYFRAFSAESANSTSGGVETAAKTAGSTASEAATPSIWTDPIPLAARILGFAGLIPFYAMNPALIRSCNDREKGHIPPHLSEMAPDFHTAYGISIASFLGAVHWGTAIAGFRFPFFWNERLFLGIVPSLLAFPAAALSEEMGSIVVMMALFAAMYNDFHLFNHGLLPYFYMRLRIYLTVFAALSYALRLEEGRVRTFFNGIYGPPTGTVGTAETAPREGNEGK